MQTYFVQKIKDKRVYFFDNDKNHIKKVMRMNVGDQVKVIYNSQTYIAEIKNVEPLHVDIIDEILENFEIEQKIDLFQASIKPSHFEWIVQKACEMHVNSIYQLILERTYNSNLIKENRIQTIIKEACEQSRRNKMVNYFKEFQFIDLINKINDYDVVLIAYENEKQQKLSNLKIDWKKIQKIAVVIGGEGGFSQEEVEILKEFSNTFLISLTKTILRSETASLYLLANLIEKII